MKFRQQFIDFWPHFLSAHLHPRTRACHLVGNVFMISCWIAFAITLHWIFLPVALLGYLPSWAGHFFFEGKEPPTLHSPIVSGLSNFKMVGLILSGGLGKEMLRLFGSENPPTGSPILVSEEAERAYQEKMRYFISAEFPEHSFKDYWEIFVLKHRNLANIWIHVIAMYFLYAVILAAAFTGLWQLLFLIPISQLMGLWAHRTFERSHVDLEDAIFSWRAFRSLNRMMVGAVTGSYWRELSRLEKIMGQKN